MLQRILIALIGLLTVTLSGAVAAQAKVPQQDWPPINGATWVNKYDFSFTRYGTSLNDKLLGGHGNDVLYGLGGSDVLWGDYKPTGNTPGQQDRMQSGDGNDWIYASHGLNTIDAGAGNDTIRVWFGSGTVDCGPGRDILYVSHKSDPNVKRVNCEKISHKSARDAAGGG
jgi:Ca2+-binding RTX toxin-like protein